MRITHFEWDEENIEHIARHGVNPEEVEEACYERPYVLKGKSNRYLIYSQTSDGRYLFSVLHYKRKGLVRVITSRDMADSEIRLCRKWRK